MILRQWNLRALRPDPRRIHGDPWPSTPFSHFRGNVREEKGEKESERKRSIYFPLAYPPSSIHLSRRHKKISARRFVSTINAPFDRFVVRKERKEREGKKYGEKFALVGERHGSHLSVVSLFSCSSFRNTGRPIFTFRLNFVFSKSEFGASPGPRWFLNRAEKGCVFPSHSLLPFFSTKFVLPRPEVIRERI